MSHPTTPTAALRFEDTLPLDRRQYHWWPLDYVLLTLPDAHGQHTAFARYFCRETREVGHSVVCVQRAPGATP